MFRYFPIAFACTLCTLAAARPQGGQQLPRKPNETFTPDPSADTMRALIERYNTDKGSIGSFYYVNFSKLRLDRLQSFSQAWLAELKKVDFDRLDQAGKVDYVLLRNELEYQLKQTRFNLDRIQETEPLAPFGQAIVALEESRWKVEPVDPAQAATALNKLADEVRGARRRVEAGEAKKAGKEAPREVQPLELTQVLAYRGAATVGSLRSVLTTWYEHYDGFKPLFTWWAKSPYTEVNKQLEEYAKYLRETVANVKDESTSPLIGDPIGSQALLDDLEHEMIVYKPDDLVRIAEREFAWCEKEMLRASNELGFGNDWKKALEKVKTLHVQPGEQDDLVAQQSRDAIKFVDDRDLVTIEQLCRETWRVDMLDINGQKVLPFAAYGGQKMLVAYPLDTMDHETKMMSLRGNNIHFTRIVTPHELIPGHHLQGYMAQRYRAYRRPFGTPFLVEGWALYWEMLLWDLQYQRSAEDRIGMLFWRMHRCARIIISLNFHLGKMKPDEMVKFLVERVGHEEWTATSEVRRYVGGNYSPLYQCAYMIGGLQLRSLYKELVTDGKMTPKQFHDAVLRENAMPVELIRASLKNVPLTRDYRAQWLFE